MTWADKSESRHQSARPATQKRRSPRDARAYIRPLGSTHCPTPATQNAHCPTPATQKKRSPRHARAYIRPLGSAHCPTPATQKRRPQNTPGRTSNPWQCTLSHACHAKEAEPKGRYIRPLGNAHCPTPATQKRRSPRDARAYIRPLGSAHCPTPATQKRRSPRDARAYIRPLGSAHCPTPATQKRWVSECEWVSVSEWVCLPRKRGGAQGTPGRTSDPLAVHIVPRLRRKRGEWVSECECEWEWVSEWVWVSWVSEWVWVECVCVWVSECMSEWVSGWVSEWVNEWVSEWREAEEEEGGYRTKNKNPTRQCGEQRLHPVLNIYYYSLTGWYWTPGDIHNLTRKVAALGV